MSAREGGISPSREAAQALLDALPADMTDAQKGPIAAIGFRLFEAGMDYQQAALRALPLAARLAALGTDAGAIRRQAFEEAAGVADAWAADAILEARTTLNALAAAIRALAATGGRDDG